MINPTNPTFRSEKVNEYISKLRDYTDADCYNTDSTEEQKMLDELDNLWYNLSPEEHIVINLMGIPGELDE